ncbi:MAG: cytidylate kinase family protein, partial [Candidatus Thermoplasmatota archaeon]|nr:cytidylate kinase family protein [Candidatus Thermoplasmatota archaeon]
RALDEKLKKILASPDSPEVVESRLSGWWAHQMGINCLRVWISVSDEKRARRIQTREGGELEERLLESKQRQDDDNQRYMELYQIDMSDMTPYNLVIDSDEIDADEVFRLVSNELGG